MRAFVVDDHPVVREGICTMLRARGMEIAGVAGSCSETLRTFPASNADVLILDLGLPDGKGVDLIDDVLRIDGTARILMLTVHDAPTTIRRALEKGALGYVLKDSPGDELVGAIESVARGKAYVSKQIAQRLAESLGKRSLTVREFSVLEHLARGLTNKAIAETIGVSQQTVKTHVRNILEKLGARDRLEAVLIATREQLVDLSGLI